ncbi:hypothetical protein EZI54_19425 [Marinobacter halodurans]|uniref:Uncharacterized protein n=1 Tax=Marinobacter halodurans TaxID=2528979 RepID=A0ABY1ZFK6_9GAMM|nr:hypothetical protein [Marinobacter halodurans]TBW49693.1 hypothetical protein EZI54_19425 [Marinobacter halodurans]
MRTRIPASTLKRLEALEHSRGKRKVVALFPELMPVDEWGAIASNMQAELKANIKKDCPPQYDKGGLSHLVLVASG